jgi:hypothetical protein
MDIDEIINKLQEEYKITKRKIDHINMTEHLYKVARTRYFKIKKLMRKKFKIFGKNFWPIVYFYGK